MKLPKPYNRYNIYFLLERALLLDLRKCSSAPTTALGYYGLVELPPLPPRYHHLKSTLPVNWYDPGRNKLIKRKHKKSHGAVSFADMVKTVADNWKLADPITKLYVEDVAKLLKKHHAEVAKDGEWMQREETVKKFDDGPSLKPKAENQLKGKAATGMTSSLIASVACQAGLTHAMELVAPNTPVASSLDTLWMCQTIVTAPKESTKKMAQYQQLPEIAPPMVSLLSSSMNLRAGIDPCTSFPSSLPCLPHSNNKEATTVWQEALPQTVITPDLSLGNIFSDCSSLEHFASSNDMVREVDMSDMEILVSYFSG